MDDHERNRDGADPGRTRDDTAVPEFRPLPADRRGEFDAIVDHAFSPEDGPGARDPSGSDDRGTDPSESGDHGSDDHGTDPPGERFGVFVGEDLRSVCVHHDFEARLRGEWVPTVGLAAVATPPEYRREGYVRRLVDASLARWRGEYPLAVLWPFDYGYYRQFGWETACKRVVYTCPPGALAFARDRGTADGRFRRLDADDWERLVDAHEAHAAGWALTLRRDGEWWRRRVFGVDDDERPYVYALEMPDGTVGAYLVYEVDDDGGRRPPVEFADGRRLRVTDLAFADEAAYLRILAFLANHDAQVEAVRFERAVGADLLDRVADPSAVDCEVTGGPMVRVVDVEDALGSLPYPDGVEADVRLAVSDDTAPWNDGVFDLSVGDGRATCERVGDPAVTDGEGDATDRDGDGNGRPADSDEGRAGADATVDVRTLSQLVVGYHSVADARRLGSLDVRNPAVAGALEALFPAGTVSLRTFF